MRKTPDETPGKKTNNAGVADPCAVVFGCSRRGPWAGSRAGSGGGRPAPRSVRFSCNCPGSRGSSRG